VSTPHFAAIADGMAFGEPTGVNPLNPIVCPCSMLAAASSAVGGGNGKLLSGSNPFRYRLIDLTAKDERGDRKSSQRIDSESHFKFADRQGCRTESQKT